MILQNENIKLRPLEPEDLDLLYVWENDPKLWNVSNTLAPFSRYILKQYIEDSHLDIFEAKQLRLIIENRDSIPIGAVDLFDFSPINRRAGIGILIYENTNKKKGYAKDAIKLMCKYAKEVIGMHQLYANVGAENIVSQNMVEKCGFVHTGTKKEWQLTASGWEDELIYQILL